MHVQKVPLLEAVAQSCSVKKMILKISQNSEKNTCFEVSFLVNMYFPVNFVKFVRVPLFTEQRRWQILRISPYLARMRENTDQKTSEYGHFSRSVSLVQYYKCFTFLSCFCYHFIRERVLDVICKI